MKPGDRLVCAFVKQLPKSATFTEWPLHVTVVPWFRLDIASANIATLLQHDLVNHTAFIVEVQEESIFGYKKRRTVNLVSSSILLTIEGEVRRLLQAKNAWIVDEADRTRLAYRPHVTVQRSGRLQEGNQFRCDRLYIVSQEGSSKHVDEIIRL